MTPPRGFNQAEYQTRTDAAQRAMGKAGLDALLLTTAPEIYYFTGFLTRFWESPTRPWFVIVPASGKPVAVIPAIGADLMGRGWVDDIRTWNAPDLVDDGVSLLAETLQELAGERGKVGLPDGMESHLRMPLSDWARLQKLCAHISFLSDQKIVRDLRNVKSPAEIEKIRHACDVANRAFARVAEVSKSGVSLSQVFRDFQQLCLHEGADFVPYLAGASDQGGYSDVISPASDQPLMDGDVLMLDTGLIWDGYFCDFNRNYSVGEPTKTVSDAHKKLIEAIVAAQEIARPGSTCSDLFDAMAQVLGSPVSGRLGHGLGMQLTEWPSIIPDEHMALQAGMVMTLEPAIDLGSGKMLVHEENIVVTEKGCDFLSSPAPRDITVL